MSYCIEPNIGNYEDSILGLGESLTTDRIYEAQVVESTFDAITTSYINDFQNKIFKAILKSSRLTEEQIQSLIYFVARVNFTEFCCKVCLTRNISIEISIENEFCFYKKSDKGVALVAIDSDGDILFNFTGYNGEFITNYYSYQQIDFELLVYQFLSK